MKQIRLWEPVYIENSKIPKILSPFSPVEIWAINVGPWVWCRGDLTKTVKRHETIHFQQQLELLFIIHWFLYVMFWIIGTVIYRSASLGYENSPFEREAYDNERRYTYLEKRKRYAWISYIKTWWVLKL